MTNFLITVVLLFTGAGSVRGEAAPPAGTPPRSSSHLLNFAMLLAEDEPAAKDGEDLSPPVAKAIADVKSLLPFKYYRQIDSVLIRSASAAPGQIELDGWNNNHYHMSFLYRCSDDGSRLDFTQFEVQRSHPGPSASGSAEPFPSPDQSLIRTSFSIDVGETIVVGTS